MIFLSDYEIDRLILEDAGQGDLTTRSLGLAKQPARIQFSLRQAGRLSGIEAAARIMQRLGLHIESAENEGDELEKDQILLSAYGPVDAVHQAWKVGQNVLEWCCGVTRDMAAMVRTAQAYNPAIQIACTRKTIPGTRALAIQAVLTGGGIMHRCGTAETVLLFANHRRFFPSPFDWTGCVAQLRRTAPEQKIIVEVATIAEASQAIAANPDIVQLDKFAPADVAVCLRMAAEHGHRCLLSAAGGIGAHNTAEYAATGIGLIVTSAPYYAKPADIRVVISPAD